MNYQNKTKEELIKELQELLQENNSLKALYDKNITGRKQAKQELIIADKELAFQNEEKGKRAAELIIADKELAFQNEEKGKRAAELIIADKELTFQNEEKERVMLANISLTLKELAFQNKEKEKRMEELARSKQLLNEAGRLARIGGWEFDLKNNKLSWSDMVYEIHEVEPDYQPTVESAINFYAPESIPVISEAVNQATEEGKSFDLDLQLITAKQNRIWVRAIGRAYRVNGEIVKIGGVFQDINERKQAEAELIIADKELVFQNEEKEKRAAELIIANKELMLAKEKEKLVAELIIVNKKLTFQITERKQAEEKLKKSYALLQIAGEKAKLGGWSVNLEENRSIWSDEVAAIHEMPTGYSPLVEDGINFYAPEWHERITKVFTDCAQEGIPYDEEMEIITANGKRVWVRTIGEPIKNDSGKIIKVQGAFQDITERKKAEDAVHQSRKELDSLFEASPELISFIGFDGYFKRLNPAWVKTLGYPMDKLLSIPFIEFVHPDDHEATNAEVAKLAEGQRTIRFDNRYRCNDGSYRWLSWSVIPDTKEKLLYAVARDITKRKQAEEKLKESEEKYRLIVENIGEGFGFTDPEEKFVIANKSADDILGVEPGELVGMNLNQFVSDDQYKLVFEETALREKGIKSVYELEIIRPNGEKRTISVTSVPKNDKDGIFIGTYALFSDITERKQAEGKALKNQYYLTKAQEIGVIGTWELDIQKDILRWTDENYKIFGVPIGTEMNLGLLFNCIHPDDRDYVNEKWSAALNNEPYDIEHRLLVRDKVKWVREKADIEFDTLGNPIIAIGFAQDITDRKLAEEKLKESEEKFRTLFQNHSTIKLLIDPDNSNIIDANRAAAVFYGWSVEKLKTMNISEINTLSPDEIKKVMNLAKNNVKNNFELKHRKADGSIWDVSIDSGIITINGKRYLYAIVRNITEHKKLEEERKQALEKLRTFATMLQINREEERKSIAREIHDEFGQVLTAIKMNLTMLGKETTKTVESSTATSILSEIDNMKQIINQTIHKVRVFTNKLRPDVLDTFGLFEALDTHISEFDKLHGIKCNFVMPDEEMAIDSNKSIAIYRIVQEALTNVARHAKATEVDISISKQDNFLNVSIEDNGKGIERTQLDDAKSFGIIGMKERAYICGGTLLLTSEPGKGTKIDLSMPIKEND